MALLLVVIAGDPAPLPPRRLRLLRADGADPFDVPADSGGVFDGVVTFLPLIGPIITPTVVGPDTLPLPLRDADTAPLHLPCASHP
jgi:hypothetical protein